VPLSGDNASNPNLAEGGRFVAYTVNPDFRFCRDFYLSNGPDKNQAAIAP
jgi:hypothetical protein